MDFGLFFISMPFALKGQEIPKYYDNPVLSGFNPDPSICRVNDDYYMVTSSFIWYPGIPIYHSKDLVNWEVIGHAIDRPTDPKEPWSAPVWLKDTAGIDPSLFWDDDGRCYYTGNFWDFKKS